jgi:hypothetical protein
MLVIRVACSFDFIFARSRCGAGGNSGVVLLLAKETAAKFQT